MLITTITTGQDSKPSEKFGDSPIAITQLAWGGCHRPGAGQIVVQRTFDTIPIIRSRVAYVPDMHGIAVLREDIMPLLLPIAAVARP